jgi:hypothetical protein
MYRHKHTAVRTTIKPLWLLSLLAVSGALTSEAHALVKDDMASQPPGRSYKDAGER